MPDLLQGLPQSLVLGADLGQASDPTAIAIVRTVDFGDDRPVYQVGHLERLPLGTPYPGVVSHVARLMRRPELRRKCELVLDFTGVGRPVFDMFVERGLDPIGVSITAGGAETCDGPIFSVPKVVLISRLQALLHAERLKILRTLPEAPALVAELQDFRAEIGESGRWKFGARAGRHDDLVLALAIAVWRANSYLVGREMMQAFGRAMGGPAEAPAAPEKPRLPWHSAAPAAVPTPDAAATPDDGIEDLTAFYRDATEYAQHVDRARMCATCGAPVGGTRTTDGIKVWHPECTAPVR